MKQQFMRQSPVFPLTLLALAATLGCSAGPARGIGAKPVHNAIVLFNGKDLSHWTYEDGRPADWKLVDNAMEVRGGNINSKEKFQDCRLHVEFMCPYMPDAKGQARGNSGVYLQDRYEVQVLDSYGLKSELGDCGAIYGQKAPDVNVCKPPLQWQTYDIDFNGARFDAAGKKADNARITVYQNGVLIHNNVEITGTTTAGKAERSEPGPLALQDHGNPVRYRNVWIVIKR